MHLMTTTEGHFLKAEARKGEGGAVRIWLQFDDCSLILSPEEAPALIGALCVAAREAAILEHPAVHLTCVGVDFAEYPDRSANITALNDHNHTTNPEG